MRAAAEAATATGTMGCAKQALPQERATQPVTGAFRCGGCGCGRAAGQQKETVLSREQQRVRSGAGRARRWAVPVCLCRSVLSSLVVVVVVVVRVAAVGVAHESGGSAAKRSKRREWGKKGAKTVG